MSNGCATVDAMDRQTAAIQALVEELRQTREGFTPAADSLASLGEAQKKLCGWIVSNRLKIVAGVPGVLTVVGTIAPNAAHIVGQLLKAWGVQ